MNEQYKTDDMYLAAYLLVRGLKIVDADRSLPHEIVLVFEETAEIAEVMAKDYESRKTTVEPRAFVSAIKQVKAIIQNREHR